MKKLILLTIAICLAEFCFSQTDFRKGYIVTNKGDTLVGLIDYREGIKAYKSCSFRESKEQNIATYEPAKIIGYGFTKDKFFETIEIRIKDQESQTVFAEVITRGIVSLYKFESTFWVKKNNEKLQQLRNESKEMYAGDVRVVKYTNEHIATLNSLLLDCLELRSDIQKVKLSERSLANLIEDYNRCKGETNTVYKEKKEVFRPLIGITGGFNASKINFKTKVGYDHLKGTSQKSVSPVFGLSVDLLFPLMSERVSIHTDFLYLKSEYKHYNQFDNSGSIKRNYVTVELEQLKIPIGIRYTFPERNFTPYVNLGLSVTTHLKSSSTWIQEVEMNNTVETSQYEAMGIRNTQFGLWGGLGILKSITPKFQAFMEFRYERTNRFSKKIINDAITALEDQESSITNIQLVIGIRIK